MLYQDDDVLVADELTSFDSQVDAIAQAEGIVLDGPGGLLRRTADECGARLIAKARGFGGGLGGSLLFYPSGPWTTRLSLTQIVTSDINRSDWSPLRSWVAHRAMSLFYRLAINNSKSDHYLTKSEWFAKEADRRYWPMLQESGLPVVYRPILRPAAARVAGTGTWGPGNLSAVAGSGPGGVFDVSISYVDASAAAGREESSKSERNRIRLNPGQSIAVNLGGLNPPTNASHWNVFCASEDGDWYLQNASLNDIATQSFTFQPEFTDLAEQDGQLPDVWMPLPQYVERL